MVVNAEQQREVLNQYGLEMLTLCKKQIHKSKEAFVMHDSDLAEEVIHTELRVNALDLKIEKDCEKFLALYNPVAIDLRFIMAIRKINFDLERIADHAEGISRFVVEQDNKISAHLLEALKFEEMFETITSMFENITVAYEEKDVKEARKVFKKDKFIDKVNIKSFSIIEAEIKKDVSITGQALILFSVIRKMERVGDLIKNIAEEIIFYIDAEVVKHKKKK
ncbi:PhoU-like phosphate uptake regulator [Ulvibacter sp. MAR_2010_11]|uniref:phosphate signaling complex protein PhoU n=1 Tax=Ulvibacter sp. MAR_2010_11 TaxID=1250229 RepID=UPI000CCA2BCB|nr:phosphate signaling complex protein PhoU [Ulvibacter sp. MAR_2010_11]PKA83150.1 PhoU-like phosphate uptake regulator [Ulvibacter sp. MAR_2010_11]